MLVARTEKEQFSDELEQVARKKRSSNSSYVQRGLVGGGALVDDKRQVLQKVALELNLLRRTVGGVEARVGVDGLRFAHHSNCCFLTVTPTRGLHSSVMSGWRVGGGGGVIARFFGGGRELGSDFGRVNEEPVRVDDAARKGCFSGESVLCAHHHQVRAGPSNLLEDERRERDGDGVEQHPDLLRRDPSREPFCEFRGTVALQRSGRHVNASPSPMREGHRLTPRTMMPMLAANIPTSIH